KQITHDLDKYYPDWLTPKTWNGRPTPYFESAKAPPPMTPTFAQWEKAVQQKYNHVGPGDYKERAAAVAQYRAGVTAWKSENDRIHTYYMDLWRRRSDDEHAVDMRDIGLR